ncbi:MAG: hypothetical protein U0746_17710 [Gemmataceae bacterium]
MRVEQFPAALVGVGDAGYLDTERFDVGDAWDRSWFVMLPPFDDVGNLPPGIHRCSAAELAARFGSGTDERETEIQELLQFMDAARAVGVRRLMVNGSFTTGKLAPNDVDVVILPGPDYPRQGQPLDADEAVWPFLQVIVAADDADFEAWGTYQFATDRRRRPKGVVEVML